MLPMPPLLPPPAVRALPVLVPLNLTARVHPVLVLLPAAQVLPVQMPALPAVLHSTGRNLYLLESPYNN